MPVYPLQNTHKRRRGFRSLRGFAPGKAAAFLLCAGLVCAGRGARASAFLINVQATGLNTSSTYGLSFVLQNISMDNSLRADVSNFSITGGGQLVPGSGFSSPFANAATGALGSDSTLSLATIDNAFDLSDYTQDFTSSTGSAAMSFVLTLSSAAPQSSSGQPDLFSFSFLDDSGASLVMTDAPDNVSLVYADFDSTTSPPARAFNSINTSGPQVQTQAQVQPSAAPEPGTLALLLPSGVGGAMAAAIMHHRRRRAAARS